jgi:DDE family transposase
MVDKEGRAVVSDGAGGGMPEIGLLPFARVAMQVATAALPTYRTRFSKHQFTQPQLLAILCLMRYEDWTFREAQVRLREHGELRAALRLSSVPDYTTVFCDVCRTTPSKTCWENRCVICAAVAIDGTGLLPHGVSTYFTRRVEQESSRKTRYRHFLKWIVVTDVDRQIVLAQRARQGPSNDAPTLPGLLETAGRSMPIGLVLADAEFDSEANHPHIRATGALSVIPARRRGVPNGEIRNLVYRKFPRKLYGPRAKIETVFSVIKRKLSAKAPGRTLPMQVCQALLLGLAFNLYRLKHRQTLRGCQQSSVSPIIATDPKTRSRNSFVCHTCDPLPPPLSFSRCASRSLRGAPARFIRLRALSRARWAGVRSRRAVQGERS